MIKSVRWRLFASMTALIVFFVLFTWILNNLYLGKYYAYKKEDNLVDTYKMVDEIYKGDPWEIALELEKTGRTTGNFIIIIGKNMELKYISVAKNTKFPLRPSDIDPLAGVFLSRVAQLTPGEYIVETARDARLDTNLMYLIAQLSNGDYIMLSTPLVAIQMNVKITNKFLFFTGLITIIIGTIVVYFFSRRFTRPFSELNDIAQRMAKLDFSKKYIVKTEDEIGQLGNSINSLSEQLNKSITELKEANNKLQEDIERERKIDEMRKEFISNVSHELKTPIALIQGYAEGLKVNVNEDEENKNFYCDVIMDEAKKMGKLVIDLLDLSMIESGGFKLEQEIFDISLLIDQVLDKYQLIFKEKDINVSVNKVDGLLVYGDPVRIEQVLVNFINNALNHVDENKKIEVSLKVENNKARLAVFNTGSTISEDIQERIWQSFYKIDKARTREYGGTGLGLSVVRVIMDLHKNNYGVINKQDGVEFWFELDTAKTP